MDNKTGASGDDYFDGSQNSNGTDTFSALDSIDGGAGTDTLGIQVKAAAAIAPGSLLNVEVINVASTAATSGIDIGAATGVTNVNLSGSSAAGTVIGIGSTSVGLGFKNTGSDGTFQFSDSALTGSSDTVSLTVQNTTAGTVKIQPTGGATTNGAETIAITSAGSGTNILTELNDGGVATSLASVTVAGSAGLTVTNNFATTVTTFNASTATGAIDVDFDAGALTVEGGSANDVFSFETTAGNVSVAGGAGNDSFQFSGTTQTFDSSDTVDGGDGSADKIILVTADAQAVASTLTKVSNIEAVEVSNAVAGAQNFTYFGSGVSAITYAAGVNNAGTQTINAGTSTITLKGAANGTAMNVTVNGSGTTDAVTIVTDTIDQINDQNITVTGAETLTINMAKIAQTASAITVTGSGSANTTLNLTGGYGLTISASDKLEAKTIDASALTVGATTNGLVMTTAATTNTSQTITGSGGIDTLFGGTGNDSISGGAGNDAITSGAGNDTILGGAGNDTLTLGNNYTTGDSIDGGDGTDTLSITATTVTALNALSLSAVLTLNDRVSNIEKLSFSNDPGASFDLARADSISDVTFESASNSGYTISSFGATNNLTLTTVTNDINVTLGDATGSSDVFNLTLKQAATTNFGTLTVGTTASTDQVETVNVVTTEGATASSTVRVHTIALDVAAGLKTLNLSGTESVTSTVSSEALATIDASGLTEGVANITSTASLVAQTVTGSAQGDTFSTGGGADSVNGAAGDDNLTGGAGNDTLDGGAGNDTVVAGVGVDSLVGGDGTDTLSATGWTIDTTTDGGSTAVAGLVINGGTTSVSAATIISYIGFNNGGGADETISSDTTAVAAGTLQAVGAAATIGSRVDTFSGLENFTGSAGEDYIVGTSGSNTITGGAEADVMTGGSDADTFVGGSGTSIGHTADSYAGATIAAADTITFGSGVDIITDFVAGTDVIDVGTAGAAITGIGETKGALTAGATIFLSGTFTIGSGLFTIAADGTGADTLIIDTTHASDRDLDTNSADDSVIILVGVDSDDLVAGSFI